MSGNGIDKFFDVLDAGADKLVGAMKDVHHPDKVYPADSESEDAEIVGEEVMVLLGLVGEGWHLFRGVTNRTYCKTTYRNEDIEARKRINGNKGTFVRVCGTCLSIAFQTQSSGGVGLTEVKKELSDGGR